MTLRTTLAIHTVNLALLAACSHTTSGLSTESGPGLLALAGPTSDITESPAPAPIPAVVVERVPEATLRDLSKMVAVREWMRRQIVSQARSIPEPRYQGLVRPQVRRQLQALGLADQDVEYILRDVDYSRGLQGHHRAPI
jgi:hypothetical protein